MAGVGAAYGKTFTVNIAGTSLTQGVTVTVDPGCGVMTPGTTGTDTQQSFTCTLNAVGTIQPRVRNLDGVELARVKLDVPLPQVSMTMTQVSSGGTATGTIVVELDPISAPITVNNFLAYVNAGFYTNTLFHRAEAGVVIQAGGFNGSLTPKTGGLRDPIVSESNNGLKNVRGTIGAARTSDPNSAQSQFYFNLKDNTGFDYVDANNPGYAVFGKIVSGLDTADKIGSVQVTEAVINNSNPPATLQNVPVNEIRITAISQTK